jgi:hypothetical protein
MIAAATAAIATTPPERVMSASLEDSLAPSSVQS